MSKKKKPYLTINPEYVDGQLALRTEYYREELFRFVKGIFKITCPETWNKNYILNVLCTRGYLIIAETNTAGILPFEGGLFGINYMNYPTDFVIENPIYSLEGVLGVDGEVVYLDRDCYGRYYNFTELILIFAEKLASADCGIDVNIMNSKLAFIAEAETQAQSATIKNAFKRITSGEPLVVFKKDNLKPTGSSLNVFFNHLKENYIANDIQDTKRRIYNEFLSKLGINNSNTDKRERLITQEVNSNTEELENNVNTIRDTLEECVKAVNRTFPSLKFNIELRYGKGETKNGIITQYGSTMESTEPR